MDNPYTVVGKRSLYTTLKKYTTNILTLFEAGEMGSDSRSSKNKNKETLA